MKKFSLIFVLLFVITALFGCSNTGSSNNVIKIFGQFGYNGRYLTEYAVKNITAEKAKEITGTAISTSAVSNSNENCVILLSETRTSESLPSNALVNAIINEYSSCKIVTTYYVNGSDQKQTKVDILQGIDFKNMLSTNQFTAFNQLISKYLLAFPDLIDFMEQKNEDWKNSDISSTAPFRNIFTYHTNATGNLIIQTRDFSEIPSSVGGGIGCSYRQDTEIIYDAQNKISKWQTSLGLQSSTPSGSLSQGYILEMDFSWYQKV